MMDVTILPDGKRIYGMHEVTMHHVARLASDLWGECDDGVNAPCYQQRQGPRGKWRTAKKKDLWGAPYWHMRSIAECGTKRITINLYKDKDTVSWH